MMWLTNFIKTEPDVENEEETKIDLVAPFECAIKLEPVNKSEIEYQNNAVYGTDYLEIESHDVKDILNGNVAINTSPQQVNDTLTFFNPVQFSGNSSTHSYLNQNNLISEIGAKDNQAHFRQLKIEKSFEFNICNNTLKHESNFCDKFECITCGKKCKTKRGLHIHKTKIHLPGNIICDSCGDRFKFKSSLYFHKHYKCGKPEIDLSDYTFKCDKVENVLPKVMQIKSPKHVFYNESDEAENVNFECSTCGKLFILKDSMLSHIKIAHPIKVTHECNICGKVFDYEPYMLRHIREFHSNTTCECEKCGKKFKHKKYLTFHTKLFHMKSKNTECNKCGKVFNNSFYMLLHMKRTHSNTTHECDKCGKLFKHRSYLTSHIRYIHKNHEKVVCDKCGKTFKRKDTLAIHKKYNHRNSDGIECDKCGKTYKRKDTLEIHKKYSHPNLGDAKRINFGCDKCEKVYKRKSYLTVHKKYCHKDYLQGDKLNKSDVGNIECNNLGDYPNVQINKSTFECDKCGKIYKRKDTLVIHKKYSHPNLDDGKSSQINFECDKCGKVFKRKSYLTAHKKYNHKDYVQGDELNKSDVPNIECNNLVNAKNAKIQFECERCGKVFKRKTYLTVHIKHTHYNTNFECDKCSKVFKRKSYLTVHKKYTHYESDAVKVAFNCDMCGKIFNRRNYLISHIKLFHLNLAKIAHKHSKFECDICRKVFKRKTYLTVHIKHTHNRSDAFNFAFTCNMCGKLFSRKSYLTSHIKKSNCSS